tara:strand:- start:132 stop:1124 length:993 start_codon:yes stop_codon:yes gene_type:complete
MNNFFLYSFLLILNFFFIFKYQKIGYFFNVYDKPNLKRKIHKDTVPLLGGIIFYINFIIIILYSFIFDEYFNLEFSSREIISLIIGSTFLFLLGLFDDKYSLNANSRLVISFLIILGILQIDKSLLIKELSFVSFKQVFILNDFSYFFTILCILLFINALNMFDGINLQVSFYCTLIFILMIYLGIFPNISKLFLFPLIAILFLNKNGKIFLGDSGCYILGFIISYLIVKNYNLDPNFKSDTIFLIMSIPGLELLRLTIHRALKGRNPFSPDNQHIHHFLLSKKTYLFSFVYIQLLIITPIVIFLLSGNVLLSILISIISYLITFFRFKV